MKKLSSLPAGSELWEELLKKENLIMTLNEYYSTFEQVLNYAYDKEASDYFAEKYNEEGVKYYKVSQLVTITPHNSEFHTLVYKGNRYLSLFDAYMLFDKNIY